MFRTLARLFRREDRDGCAPRARASDSSVFERLQVRCVLESVTHERGQRVVRRTMVLPRGLLD